MPDDLESRRDPRTHLIAVAGIPGLTLDPCWDQSQCTVRSATGGPVGWVNQIPSGEWLPVRFSGHDLGRVYETPDQAALALWLDVYCRHI